MSVKIVIEKKNDHTYVNFLISLFLRSACETFDDDKSFTKWPRQVKEKDSNKTNVNNSWPEWCDKLFIDPVSSRQQNELPFEYSLSTTERASSTSQINKSDAVHDLTEPMASVCLTDGPEKKNVLEERVLETINNLLIQLRNDLPNEKDWTTKLEDRSSLDLQVCLFDPMNYFRVNNASF